MLYARSDTDLASVVASVVGELAAAGLHSNTSKAKILTTQNLKELMFLAIGGDTIEVLHEGQNHRYFGKKIIWRLSEQGDGGFTIHLFNEIPRT